MFSKQDQLYQKSNDTKKFIEDEKANIQKLVTSINSFQLLYSSQNEMELYYIIKISTNGNSSNLHMLVDYNINDYREFDFSPHIIKIHAYSLRCNVLSGHELSDLRMEGYNTSGNCVTTGNQYNNHDVYDKPNKGYS